MTSDASSSQALRSLMLPRFPEFCPIELEYREHILQLTNSFLPYADFNFVELWCWNRGESGGASTLNGNLVVRWEDVVTGELFLTFIGRTAVEETASTLIDHALENGIDSRLLAVPGVVIDLAHLDGRFAVEDDPVNWDYLLSTAEWSAIGGARFKNKRNAIHRLQRNHDPTIRRLDLSDCRAQADVRRVCELWAELRQRTMETTRAEFAAIEKLLLYARKHRDNRLFAIGVYEGDQMVGFSINEELGDRFAIGHFAKADYRYEGIYPYMLRHVCQHMYSLGIEYLNIEADLGDPGLAIAKRLCHPVGMLKKYVISRAQSDVETDSW